MAALLSHREIGFIVVYPNVPRKLFFPIRPFFRISLSTIQKMFKKIHADFTKWT